MVVYYDVIQNFHEQQNAYRCPAPNRCQKNENIGVGQTWISTNPKQSFVLVRMRIMQSVFDLQLKRYSDVVQDYIMSHRPSLVRNVDMKESVVHYSTLGGKKLRPFAVLTSCGAVGGNPDQALPLAAGVEMFHTWTLVHDDIIDRDPRRRWGDSVHARWTKVAISNYGYEKGEAEHYGLDVGILAGDLQHGWAVGGLIPQLLYETKVESKIVVRLINELYVTLQYLVNGEIDDVYYSKLPISEMTSDKIKDMLWEKTGSLYRYCGLAGAMVGRNTDDLNDAYVTAVAEFAAQCGLAFQVQDDILGITGKEEQLGKSTGSDLREGKRTLLILWAYNHTSSDEKKVIEKVLGNPKAAGEDVEAAVDVIRKVGGIDYAADMARKYIEGGSIEGKEIRGARKYLEQLDDSEYKGLLTSWADYLITRRF
jgi:geranylgeranyl diphosphate synthase type I